MVFFNSKQNTQKKISRAYAQEKLEFVEQQAIH